MDFLAAAGTWVVNNIDTALAIVGGFAILASKTPNTVDDRIGQWFMDAINFLGANLGKAKNQ